MVKNVITTSAEHKNIIIAPHADDEVIGCYEIIMNERSIVIYTNNGHSHRGEEATKLKATTMISEQLFNKDIPTFLMDPKYTYYFPDPIYETHPDHRRWGSFGEQMVRNGFDVVFYSTNMQAPYIHEVQDYSGKLKLLNNTYMSQKSLWEYDHRYYLFEGRVKWLM